MEEICESCGSTCLEPEECHTCGKDICEHCQEECEVCHEFFCGDCVYLLKDGATICEKCSLEDG